MEFELNELHLHFLKRLRSEKKSFLIKAFVGFIVLASTSLFAPFGLTILGGAIPGSNWFQQHKYQLIAIVLLALILYKLIDYFFIKTFAPLNKDIKQKTGVTEKHQIIRKQHFPITDDYFFFFAEMEIPNTPVSSHTFNQYQAGDYFSIQKAKHSKIIFEYVDRYSINADYVFEETGQ